MMIVGCDLHARYQQIAMPNEQTGELIERRLEHENGEARGFYGGWRGLCGPPEFLGTLCFSFLEARGFSVNHFTCRKPRAVGALRGSKSLRGWRTRLSTTKESI
jgi:hypothetical protein